jgi:hypothetical protein
VRHELHKTVLEQIDQGGIRGDAGGDAASVLVRNVRWTRNVAIGRDSASNGTDLGVRCSRFCSDAWFARVRRSPFHIVRSATIYSQHSGWRSLIMKSSYSLAVVCAGILLGVTAAPCSLAAQTFAMRPAAVTATSGVAASAVGPIVEQAALHNASTESRVVADQDVGPHVNRGLALTVAGIAAVGVGYAVKGQAGTMIALGGGALALYGLYNWIK